MPLGAKEMEAAFKRLGELALEGGHIVDMAVYGGSALAVASPTVEPAGPPPITSTSHSRTTGEDEEVGELSSVIACPSKSFPSLPQTCGISLGAFMERIKPPDTNFTVVKW